MLGSDSIKPLAYPLIVPESLLTHLEGKYRMNAPSWLDDVARGYWKRLLPEVKNEMTAGKAEIFAVFCQCLADYRIALESKDTRQRKIMLDFVLRFAKEFRFTMKATKSEANQLDDFLDIGD